LIDGFGIRCHAPNLSFSTELEWVLKSKLLLLGYEPSLEIHNYHVLRKEQIVYFPVLACTVQKKVTSHHIFYVLLQVMIATVTVAQEQIEETISTCRFAQRVAMISNQV
jgi:hypothetical protein